MSGSSSRQTVHTHRASVHQAAKLVAALEAELALDSVEKLCIVDVVAGYLLGAVTHTLRTGFAMPES